MAITLAVNHAVNRNGLELASASFEASGETLLNGVYTVPAASSVVIPLAVDVSAVTHVTIKTELSDGSGDASTVTLTANDDGTPDLTLTLKSAAPFTWTKDSGVTNPLLSTDWTSFKLATAGAEATVTVVVIVDN